MSHASTQFKEYFSVFVTQSGAPTEKQVPDSCIQSAEYIIQCWDKGKWFAWAPTDKARRPHVYAHFENRSLNISTDDVLQPRNCNGVETYKFKRLPKIGEGLMLLHCKPVEKKSALTYFMHCMAVVAENDTSILVSDNMETNPDPDMAEIKLRVVSDLGSLAKDIFGYYSHQFALGLLSTSKPKAMGRESSLRRNSFSMNDDDKSK